MMNCQWVRIPQVLLDENGGSGCSINQSINQSKRAKNSMIL
jgi:hypothetical protein